jgi:hypothetical protein
MLGLFLDGNNLRGWDAVSRDHDAAAVATVIQKIRAAENLVGWVHFHRVVAESRSLRPPGGH